MSEDYKKTATVFDRSTDTPCPVCLTLLSARYIEREMVMPVPKFGPRSLSGHSVCFDCESAEGLLRFGVVPEFTMARLAVGNERCEQLRLPEGAACVMGLAARGLVKISDNSQLVPHHEWLGKVLPLNEDDSLEIATILAHNPPAFRDILGEGKSSK